MRRLLLLTVVTFVLFGCAASRIVYTPETDSPERFSEVFVYCKIAYIGSGVFTKLTIDGVEIAGFYGGHYVHLKINPGIHTIAALTPHNIMILKKNFKHGIKYYFDATYIRKKGHLSLPEIEQSVAEEEISKLKIVK